MSLEILSKAEGAELTSIIFNGKEMLHQGKEYWNRHAPVLFPIVGQIKNGETLINGNTYKMGQHGFARDMTFEEINKSEIKHEYVLRSNNETLEKYPFKFELYVTHEVVNDNEVVTTYKVINKDEKEILFGLGGHPAYLCDYSTGDYVIEFEKNEDRIEFLKLDNGLLSNNHFEDLIEEGNKIRLHKDIFSEDAIIMKNINSSKVKLVNTKINETLLEFDFTGFPYLALWAKVGAPFVCIEPWFNTADKVDSNGEFKDKENILHLKPNEKFECKYKVKF